MKEVDILADTGDLCGESPLWVPRDSALYWIDNMQQKLQCHSWPAGTSRLIRNNFEMSGLASHTGGGFAIVNSRGIWLLDKDSDLHLVADSADGRRCVLNDCIADPEGRLFAGSCFFDPTLPKFERGCLFRVDTNGKTQVVDEGFFLANGLGFSPENSILYLTDSAERVIYSYEYLDADGSVRNRRGFKRVPASQGIPDGLTVDSAGFVWSAQWFGGCVVRYDPDGKEERRIAIPAAQVSSLAFGGPELTDLFITSPAMSDALPLAPAAYCPGDTNLGGQLFHIALDIPGKLEFEVRVLQQSASGHN
jgi:sugar lactone lactonase YvrE